MIISAGNFPAGFMWGAATAAYQIEGAVNDEGRGKSIWDTFSHTPGKIVNGDTGDRACEHYHRWQADIDIMQQLGLNAYRFSIAWPRILPQGRGKINQAGLDFYSRLIDHLLAAGITPFVTLYHWDLPQGLQDDGDGWQRRGIIDDFSRYVDIVSRELGDRVHYWTTINEPGVFTWGGYVLGEDAPGWRKTPAVALAAIHHVLLAHGAAVQLLRTNVPGSHIGIVLDVNVAEPATDSPEDIAAAYRFDGFQNRWFLDPLFHGKYPSDMVELYEEYMPIIQNGDMPQIQVPLDYLGINYYRRSVIAHGTDLPPVNYRRISSPGKYTTMDWEVYPRGLYDILKYVHTRYAPAKLYVTENGAAFADVVDADGRVHDEQRISYLRTHLEQVRRAIADGVPLAGYFVWSLLDNFEWTYGYDQRFGVVYVDYETQQRIIKESGYFLARVIGGEEIGQHI